MKMELMVMVTKNMKNEDVFENVRVRVVRNSKGLENGDKVSREESESYVVKVLETGNSKRETEKKSGPASKGGRFSVSRFQFPVGCPCRVTSFQFAAKRILFRNSSFHQSKSRNS